MSLCTALCSHMALSLVRNSWIDQQARKHTYVALILDPRRSLLPLCPHEVWNLPSRSARRLGRERTSVIRWRHRAKVASRPKRAGNALGLGCIAPISVVKRKKDYQRIDPAITGDRLCISDKSISQTAHGSRWQLKLALPFIYYHRLSWRTILFGPLQMFYDSWKNSFLLAVSPKIDALVLS